MSAALVIKERYVYPDGDLVEMVVWRLPKPVPPTLHGYKYRFVYIRDGERVLGYDNERGKGDHRHFRGVETPITFIGLDLLLEAFVAEVEQMREEK